MAEQTLREETVKENRDVSFTAKRRVPPLRDEKRKLVFCEVTRTLRPIISLNLHDHNKQQTILILSCLEPLPKVWNVSFSLWYMDNMKIIFCDNRIYKTYKSHLKRHNSPFVALRSGGKLLKDQQTEKMKSYRFGPS